MESSTSSLTVVDVNFEGVSGNHNEKGLNSSNCETLRAMLNTPSLSPQESDDQDLLLGKRRKQALPNRMGKEGSSDLVVKTEEFDYSLSNYEDIAAPDDIHDQLALARLEAQKLNSQHREDCPICGDRANGLHYGVYTCEGCKNFFKRSVVITQTKPYVCNNQNDCDVRIVIDMSGIKRKGARCQACRYTACLNAGMYHSGYPRSYGGGHTKQQNQKNGGQDWTEMISGYISSQNEQGLIKDDISPSKKSRKEESFSQPKPESFFPEECENGLASENIGHFRDLASSVLKDQLEFERSKNRELELRMGEKDKQLKIAEKQVSTMMTHMSLSQRKLEEQQDEIIKLKHEIGRLGIFRNSMTSYRHACNGDTDPTNGEDEESVIIPSELLDVNFQE